MLHNRRGGLLGVAALAVSLISAFHPGRLSADSTAPPLDKAFLERYIRYAEGFTPDVKFTIDDPQKTPYSGYFRLVVHLQLGQTNIDKVYYLSGDGKRLVSGAIWDFSQNPFVQTAQEVPTDGPSFGPADAKVTIVVFSDFQCPYCREFAKTTRDNLPQKYPKDVRLIFKDFPIDSLHPWARAAAESGQCFQKQNLGAFWAFHDWIFQHQQEITQANLREKAVAFAKEQKLDSDKLAHCLDGHVTLTEVMRSENSGKLLQVQQTPSFFVNGRPISGALSWASLNSVIQLELNRPAGIPAAPALHCCDPAAGSSGSR